MRKVLAVAGALLLAMLLLPIAVSASNVPDDLVIQEYKPSAEAWAKVRAQWVEEMLASYPVGTWAPMKFEPTDEQLDMLGLPPRKVLLAHRYPVPTMVYKDGRTEEVELPPLSSPMGTLGPTVASFAGAGWFGIRPGAFLLLITNNSIGWCSMAHVYGSPGSYKISTAGHCGDNNQVATVIAAFGNRNGVLNPILLDFGKFSSSTDGGLGRDWALISIDSAWQSLTTPTMAFWGGPRGMFTKTGDTVAVTFPGNSLIPNVSVNPDPFLVQTIVHYGHGVGLGTGGTARAGEAIAWRTNHYMFFGAISPGDSGSGSNTLGGDTVGANMEAAGIMTHLYIDLLMREGLGIMGGTRATKVRGTLANGQIVPYPVPAPGLP